MPETIEMTADDPNAPSFGGGATRVLSENELDGLIEATVSVDDVNHPRAPKETKRIEALARIQPGVASTETRDEADAAATEAALLDAASTGSSIVVEASLMQPTPAPVVHPEAPARVHRLIWLLVLLAAAIAGAVAMRAFLPH